MDQVSWSRTLAKKKVLFATRHATLYLHSLYCKRITINDVKVIKTVWYSQAKAWYSS